ncbi:hypothetical protein GWK36_05010 [Caldichromatium japonicum]|uniref:DUF4340 domain-containing protein n=1 Tax=Caldichromatium japonicum TaxID=2699430 RepID=A0A6G7VBW4_9GAMM|nr:hypothetical protein [Caldichromatium japonicum]QIK37442.1 hypothetical protein GWK36_05010 [Caldichromatium japonicum]
MSKRWLINGVLFGVLIILVALIRAELERARFVPLLTDLTAADVYRVEILRPGEPAISLIQTALGWHLETPFQIDAENARVNRMLGVLEAPVERSFPAQSADLRELGLLPPRLRLRIDGRELQFGLTDPIAKTRYVVADGLVHLIPDYLYHLLIAPPIDYVSAKLIPLGFAPIFGRLGENPLAAETLSALAALHAERVEVMSEMLIGTPLVLKAEDGTALDFLVSTDRKRWARPNQRLLYVLSEPVALMFDPNVSDPFADMHLGSNQRETLEGGPTPQSPSQTSELGSLAAPPIVHLPPDDHSLPRIEQAPALYDEPNKPVPNGLGQDPFAPEPNLESSPIH